MDAQVEKLMDTLKASCQLDNTLVVFFWRSSECTLKSIKNVKLNMIIDVI